MKMLDAFATAACTANAAHNHVTQIEKLGALSNLGTLSGKSRSNYGQQKKLTWRFYGPRSSALILSIRYEKEKECACVKQMLAIQRTCHHLQINEWTVLQRLFWTKRTP